TTFTPCGARKRCLSAPYWAPTLKRLRIPSRPPYNTRHTYAMMMLMAGMNPAFGARQLGHDVKALLSTYSRWLYRAADHLEMQRLERSIGPGRAPKVGSGPASNRFCLVILERAMGIEPTLSAWEAEV